jgi:hypothetical protein
MKIRHLVLGILISLSIQLQARAPLFLTEASSDTSTWDVTDYSQYKTANQYLETYPEHQDFSNFPDFSWDSVPRWLAIRKAEPYTDSELESIANNFQMLMLEKANTQGIGSVEEGTLNAAQRIKAFNPNIKILFYWNSWINYLGYAANEEYDKNAWEWSNHTTDSSGNEIIYIFKDRYYTHNYEIPGMRKWWVKTALEMANHESIDGVFIDKVHAYEGPFFINGKPATNYIKMQDSLSSLMPDGKLFFGNTLRNERWNGNREHMRYSAGSYFERWHMVNRDSDPRQIEADAISVSIQLMRESLLKKKITNLNAGPEDSEEVIPSTEANLKSHYRASLQFPLAVFLIAADTGAYFGYKATVDARDPQWQWNISYLPEFHRPLGKPLGDPIKDGYVYTRSYEKLDVWVNVETKEAKITWKDYPELMNLSLVVRNSQNGYRLPETNIAIDKISRITDGGGEVNCALDSGSYVCTITKEGYFTKEISVDIDSDSVIYFDLESTNPDPVYFTLKFKVSEANSSAFVPGATIALDTLIKPTNSIGEQYFVLDSGTYLYNISLSGYFPLDSSIHLISDSTVTIKMLSTTADVKFRIKEGESPLGSAAVSLNENEMQTNNVGLAVYSDLPVFENYIYSIGKDGYETISGDFLLQKDTTINIALNVVTGVHSDQGNLLKIYPLPVDNYVMIESMEEMMEIKLVDLNGRVLNSERVSGRLVRKEVPEGMPAIFMLKVVFSNGTEISRRIVSI